MVPTAPNGAEGQLMYTSRSRSRSPLSISLIVLVCACLGGMPGAAQALEAGDKAPAFSAPTLGGDGHVSLAAYKGKVVYLDFWASWCAPCLTSLPLLEELRKELAGQDFQILAVNVDKDRDKAKRFLARHPIGYPSVSDPEGKLPETFGLKTMPTSFLIDRNGVIRHIHDGFRPSDMAGLKDRIRALLEK
jgi:peroxiredoxin